MASGQGAAVRSRLGAVLVALVAAVTVVPASASASPVGALAPPAASLVPDAGSPVQAGCGGGRLKEPSGVRNPSQPDGTVPVVFVHGIVSSAAMWSDPASDGGSNLTQSVAAVRQIGSPLPAASVWAFDYGDVALEWVTDPRIGPALAEAIRCLHEASGNEVVLVAHSMGGLAIQYALGQPGVAEHVAHVTTIATPFEGSRILTALNRSVRSPNPVAPASALVAQIVLDYCAQLTREALASGGGFACYLRLAGAPSSPIGRALMVGSSEIAALPPWPGSLPAFRVAGDIVLLRLPGGRRLSVGDLAVTRDSALSGGVPDVAPPRVIECAVAGGTSLPSPGIRSRLRCEHTHLAKDREVIDAVLAQIEPVVRRLADGAEREGGSDDAGGAVVTPGFPEQVDVTLHGGTVSAVYLAVTDSYDDPALAEAQAAAESVGYTAGLGDLGCDVGAAEALGRDQSFGAAVAVYFDGEENAGLARDAFEERGIPVVGVANVGYICLD